MTGQDATALPARARAVLGRLPPGAVDAAVASLKRGLTAAGADRPSWTTEAAAARQLVRPLVEADDWPGPSAPLVVGPGAVHADLIDSDHDLLARLRELLGAEGRLDPETLATDAQQWRLPVTPYRRLAHHPTPVGASPSVHPEGPGWAEPPMVIDLTSLWAGPLATGLLAALGARVVKIDPDCRPDGFRAHPGLYASLNGAKEIIDLDLRRPDHRACFESLVARADLVVDSFSRRVMPNFGYGPADLRRLNPSVATLSIVAFPAGSPEADWVSYGPGVHAASGLADPGAADPGAADPGAAGPARPLRFRPAEIAYPDALAGLSAFAVAAELLAARPVLDPRAHREVSLAGALAPLVARAQSALMSAGVGAGGNAGPTGRTAATGG